MNVFDISHIRRLLVEASHRPDKRLGQNFLANGRSAYRIRSAAHLSGNETVIEIGAGLGHFTAYLAEQSHQVVAFELDEHLVAWLTTSAGLPKNVTIRAQDFLTFDFAGFIRSCSTPVTIIGNIPYYISGSIIRRCNDVMPPVLCAVLTMQKEVAQRLTAPPGGKSYGPLSVYTTVRMNVDTICDIPANQFYPKPNVSSRVVRLRPRPDAPVIRNPALFEAVVKSFFHQRRKILRHSLEESPFIRVSKDRIAVLCAALNIDLSRRGEEIPAATIYDFYTRLLDEDIGS